MTSIKVLEDKAQDPPSVASLSPCGLLLSLMRLDGLQMAAAAMSNPRKCLKISQT